MSSLQSEDLLIAVTDYNKVYLICRIDEGVAWTVDNIDRPSAVCVDNMFVFVTDSNKRVIILDNGTGKIECNYRVYHVKKCFVDSQLCSPEQLSLFSQICNISSKKAEFHQLEMLCYMQL